MRLSIASSALAAAFVLTPVAAGYAPALCQDFSITNQVEPANAWRRDMMRQLQAWWDAHAYYPRHASNSDEGGNEKVRIVIAADGQITSIEVVQGSGLSVLDAAAVAVFRNARLPPFPPGTPVQPADVVVTLHYRPAGSGG